MGCQTRRTNIKTQVAVIVIVSILLLGLAIIDFSLINKENKKAAKTVAAIMAALETMVSILGGFSFTAIQSSVQISQTITGENINIYYVPRQMDIRSEGKAPADITQTEDRFLVDVTSEQENDTSSSTDMVVRVEGDKEWFPAVYADVGDVVEFQMCFINYSDTVKDVMARVVLPTNTEYVDGSTVLYNSNYQDGVKVLDDTLSTTGINIGGYTYRGNAYVRFKAIVTDKTLVSGRNLLCYGGSFTVNRVVFKESASVAVVK